MTYTPRDAEREPPIFHCSRCDFATDDSSKLVYAWDDAYSGERLADIFCPLCGAPVEEKPE